MLDSSEAEIESKYLWDSKSLPDGGPLEMEFMHFPLFFSDKIQKATPIPWDWHAERLKPLEGFP